MTSPLTAFIDMEFAGIYGTHQRMQIPIEIGVVMHEPETDTLSFAGRPFSYDIDVELWKNVTDEVGKRVNARRRVFSLAVPGHEKPFDRRFNLDSSGHRQALDAINAVHADLRGFIQSLNRKNISTLVFFARDREMTTFNRAKVNTDGFVIRDLQQEIKTHHSLKEHVSLDRMTLVTGFGIGKAGIYSIHFRYAVPEKIRYIIKPHKAIGDAARMFLLSRELSDYPGEFEQNLNIHLAHYEQKKNGNPCSPVESPGSGV
jgi:hypothetical protein